MKQTREMLKQTGRDSAARRPQPNQRWRTARRAVPTLLAILALTGCHGLKSKTSAQPAATNAPPRVLQTAWAEVAYVNVAQGYVVLRAKVLQSAAGEATVWRGTNEVARLRVGGPARPPWLTADILSGHPQPRDRVEMKW